MPLWMKTDYYNYQQKKSIKGFNFVYFEITNMHVFSYSNVENK